MDKELRFAADLYQGTAGHYDRYRLPYPEAMTGELIQRAGVSGDGRLLDLACGTGQLAFPLRQWFSEVSLVDTDGGPPERSFSHAAGLSSAWAWAPH